MTFSVSFGRWGGFYFHRDYTIRLCLGWLAFTFYPFDMDDLHNRNREAITTMAGMMDDQSRRLAELECQLWEAQLEDTRA